MNTQPKCEKTPVYAPVIRIIVFVCLLGCILGKLNNIFKYKYADGIYSMKKFYELDKNSVDVLVLGSSHAFENINTSILWNDYGIAAYDLCASAQPIWNTYFYLKEALKTQTPKVIVLEGFTLTFPDDYREDRVIKSTFGMKWSKNKIDAIRASVPEEEQDEFFLEYIKYHSRYKELNKEDFLVDKGKRMFADWKGFVCNPSIMPFEKVDFSGVTERRNMTAKTEKYYRAIIEEAKERNIPICIVISPYAGVTYEDQRIYNAAYDIAKEYNVLFINYNNEYAQKELNFESDFADIHHLSYLGNSKYTKEFGAWLKEHYSLIDRRGDERYNSWENDAKYIMSYIRAQNVKKIEDIDGMLKALRNKSYVIFVSVDGDCTTSDSYLENLFDFLGISGKNQNGIWIFSEEVTQKIDTKKYMCLDDHNILMNSSDTTNNMIFDNVNYAKVINGVNIVVYDSIMGEVIDSFGIDAKNAYIIVR